MEANDLIKAAKKGNGEAFVEVVSRYERTLYKVAKRILENDMDVADAMQETILSAYENIYKLENDRYFNTWICKILINKCYSIQSRNKKIIYVDDVLVGSTKNDFLKVELNDALNSLNKDYKLALILYYIVGLNIKEIGEFINEPEGTVKSRLSRAKTILRNKYYDGEGGCEYGR